MATARARNKPLVGIVLLLLSSLAPTANAQAPAALTRVALYAPMGRSQDPALLAALSTVADSVEISLVVMQRYDVRRLPSADPDSDIAKVRAFCDDNHIDQAILGSGSEKPDGGFDFRLLVYDRKSNSITIDRRGSSAGALDMFDTTDALVASLLQGLSGTHLLFGSLTVDTNPAGAAVALNGRDAGAAPLSLRGLPTGPLQITARAPGFEDAQASAAIADGETASASLRLERSTGTLSVQMPSDGQLTVSGAEIGTKQLTGLGSLTLPTGTYQLAATSAGLAAASGQITVSRNAAVNWLPWARGYLDVRGAPEGSTITVDGVDKGTAPLLVEVDPGVLHRVTVTKNTYAAYVADLSSPAGQKTFVEPELIPLPGSVRVVTSIAGADVSLDNGAIQATPFVFEDVPAGEHHVKITDVTLGNRIYTAGPALTIQVAPAETTVVSKELTQGVARLRLTDAPTGAVVQVDGSTVDSSALAGRGAAIPAGSVKVTVTAPSSQMWMKTVAAGVGTTDVITLEDFVWQVPKNAMPNGGKPDDWKDVLPVWPFGRNSSFKDQPGTHFSRGYLAMDSKRLYARFIFSDGTPRGKELTKEFTEVLGYSVYFYPTDGTQDRIEAHVRFLRSAFGTSTETSYGVFSPATGNWTDLGGGTVSYRVDNGELLMSVPLDPLRSVVKKRIMEADLFVSNEPVNGPWKSSNETGRVPVDFGF